MKLWCKVLIGLMAGVLFGYIMNPQGPFGSSISDYLMLSIGESSGDFLTHYVKPVGTVFINLIKMVVVPLIFFSLIAGITSMTEPDAFKRIGIKAVTWYLCTGAFAVVIGIVFGLIFQPGQGVDLSQLSLHADPNAKTPSATDSGFAGLNGVQILIKILVGIIPTNIFAAMAEDHILQVVVFAIFVGITINGLGEKVKGLRDIAHQLAQLVFKMIETVIKFSPYGVFALISWMVGTQGFDIVKALAKLAIIVCGALFVQYLLFGVLLLIAGRLKPWPFYRKVLETQSLAFSTSSSKATLPTAMRVANERMGVSKPSTSFVLPLGASINMDGTAIYLGICALFFSQAHGLQLVTHQYLLLVMTATLGSIGAAGIPGGSLIMMGMVLTSVGLPLEGIALIAGIDRILDMMRTTINITGDTVITVIVDRSEGCLDEQKYYDKSL